MRFVTFYRRRCQTEKSGYNAICATLERITAPIRHTPIPDTSATPDAIQLSIAAYYNKVYKGASLSWIHARRCSISQTMPARRRLDASHARRLEAWHRVSGQGAPAGTIYPAGQSSDIDAAGGAELLTAVAVSLFGLSPDSQ